MGEVHYIGQAEVENDSIIVPAALVDVGFPEKGQVILGYDQDSGYLVIQVAEKSVSNSSLEPVDITQIGSDKIKIPNQGFLKGVLDGNEVFHLAYTNEMIKGASSVYALTIDQLQTFIPGPDCWATQKDIERLRNNGLTKQGNRIKSIESGSKLDFDKFNFTADDKSNDIIKIFSSIDNILELSKTVDSELRPKIRVTLRDLEEHGFASDLYRSAVEGQIRQSHDFSLEGLLESLNTDTSLTDSIIGLEPDVVIEISDQLSSIKFTTDRTTLEIEEPELLWDCHCERPHGEFSAEQRPKDADNYDCPIHQHPHGDELRTKFLEGLVLIKYKGVEVFWYNVPDFWPVSADSIHMYDNLDNEGILSSPFTSVLDVGCGTGFLGIAATHRNPEIRHLSMSDWLLTPVVFSRINWEKNYGSMIKSVSFEPRLGLGFNWMRQRNSFQRKFDLCLCNPPYLPEVEEYPEVNMQNAVGGTDLLEKVISDGENVAERVIVNFSDLALPEAEDSAKAVGGELVQVGHEHHVPFRVRSALRSEGYMEELESREIEIREQGRYKYWHTVRTYEIQYK